jgi:hypothetical protein
VARLLKDVSVKLVETAVARERLCKHALARQWLSIRHVIAATVTHAIMEVLLEVVFSVRSVQRLYNENHLPLPVERERERDCRQTVEIYSCEKCEAGSGGWGEFGNPEKGERWPLEAATKQHSEDRD